MSAETWERVLRWCYADHLEGDLDLEALLRVYHAADMLLLETLKARCAVLLHPHVTADTAVGLLQLAEETNCGRLTEMCCRAIAQHLEQLSGLPELRQAVVDSARSVRNREATDSIPILDDISFHVRELHGDGELSDDEDGDIEYGENGGWMPAPGGVGARAAVGEGAEEKDALAARVRFRGFASFAFSQCAALAAFLPAGPLHH